MSVGVVEYNCYFMADDHSVFAGWLAGCKCEALILQKCLMVLASHLVPARKKPAVRTKRCPGCKTPHSLHGFREPSKHCTGEADHLESIKMNLDLIKQDVELISQPGAVQTRQRQRLIWKKFLSS